MQLFRHQSLQTEVSRRCSRRSCSVPSVPIRTRAPQSRDCSVKGSNEQQLPASSQFAAELNSGSSPAANGRQTYIQESVSFTGAELAARLPSMQAAMRARADAIAAASGSSIKGWGATAARSSAAPRSPSSPVATPSMNDPYSASSGASGYTTVSAAATATAATTSISSRPQAIDASTTYSGNSGSSYSNGTTSYSNGTSSSNSGSNGANSGDSSVASIPSPRNLAGLSASQKLQALQQVQAASRQALAQASNPSSPYYANAPKTIDVRMYDQLVVAHNKLSKKLGESNAHIGILEGQVSRANQDLMAAYELLKQIAMEFGTTSRLAQGTAAAIQFGVDPQDALDKIAKLQERLSTLEQAVLEQRQEFGQRVVREVPVEWIGVASEVKVMGDFDDWTRGHELSAEDVTSDSVYSRFEGKLMLRPGTYRVKFLVDGEWRLAADWPTEDDGQGNTVCVLKVA